jgi:hypothetical protein
VNPGEFGALNTALAAIGLMTVPVLALQQVLLWYPQPSASGEPTETTARLRTGAPLLVETFAWAWAVVTFIILTVLLPWLGLTRFPTQVLVILNVFAVLAGLVAVSLHRSAGRLALASGLLLAAAAARLVLGAGIAAWQPWSEAILAAFIAAGLILLGPILNRTPPPWTERLQALGAALNRDFLVYFTAAVSVFTGIYLFTSADRLVAQSWFGGIGKNAIEHNADGMVLVRLGTGNPPLFDAYQSAGLIARSWLWALQPLLFAWFAQRSPLGKSTAASLTWFWIYLALLVGGLIALALLATPIGWLFSGDDGGQTSGLLRIFVVALFPLGLLQGLGFFALASRRFHECYVIGSSSLAYTLFLYLFGRQPLLMPSYMFGGSLICLMLVLFVGVVRWGRKQP